MYKFSKSSKEKLETVDEKLQTLFIAVLSMGIFDITIIEGKRSLERQKQLVTEGKSKTLESKHLTGKAIDVAIFKNNTIDWDDTKAYYVLVGVVLTLAKQLGISIRSGSNWDLDTDYNDQDFNDLVHFELDE